MKTRFAFFAVFALALASAFSAHAADDFYKASDYQGNTVSTNNAYRLDHANGLTTVAFVNGASQTYNDPAGTLAARIVQNQPEFIKIGNSWGNAIYAARISCSNGKTIYSLQNSGVQITADDGCIGAQTAYNKAK